MVITEARERLLTRAAKISDLRWRERFLTQVPDNAQTLALAQAVGSPVGGSLGGSSELRTEGNHARKSC